MPKLIQYQCDIVGCKSVRGESNHWFIANIARDGSILFEPFNPQDYQEHYTLLCGEDHVTKFLSGWLNSFHEVKGSEAPSSHNVHQDKNVVLCKNCGLQIVEDGRSTRWIHIKDPQYYGCNNYNAYTPPRFAEPPDSYVKASE